MNKERRFAPSKIITVRFHKEELDILDKKKGRLKRSEYIRAKTLL